MSAGPPLRVGARLLIPADELRWRFDTSGGPGGQHANRNATRVELSFDVNGSPSIPEALRPGLLQRLGNRARGGVVTVLVDDSRSQWRNRQTARHRLAEILEAAIAEPRARRPTRPTLASLQRRLTAKRHRSENKRWRKRPSGPEEE